MLAAFIVASWRFQFIVVFWWFQSFKAEGEDEAAAEKLKAAAAAAEDVTKKTKKLSVEDEVGFVMLSRNWSSP